MSKLTLEDLYHLTGCDDKWRTKVVDYDTNEVYIDGRFMGDIIGNDDYVITDIYFSEYSDRPYSEITEITVKNINKMVKDDIDLKDNNKVSEELKSNSIDINSVYPKRLIENSYYGIKFEAVDQIEVYKDKDESEIIDLNESINTSIDLVFLVSDLISLVGNEKVYNDLQILKVKYEGESND